MAEPDFIVPPPGLIPGAPSETPDRTVRDAPPRVLPTFPPPGVVPVPAPGVAPAPPGAPAAEPPSAAPPTGETRIEAPTPTPQPGAWRLRANDGLEVLLLRPIVLGRDPVADATAPEAAPIRLVDPARSVSKTHALVEVVDGRVRVTDLHSTNGTRVLTPDGRARELEPGVAGEVAGGSTLLLGEFAVRLDRAPLHTV